MAFPPKWHGADACRELPNGNGQAPGLRDRWMSSQRRSLNSLLQVFFGTSIGDAGRGYDGFSDDGPTFGFGGGVDVNVTPRFGVRGQFDLLGSFADIVEGNSRVFLGGVWRF